MAVKKSRTMMARPSNESTPSIIAEESGVVVQMDLGLEIDSKETAANVRRFWTHGINRYLYQAGLHRNQLKSPTLSLAGGGGSTGNHAEDRLISGMQAQRMCDCIRDTLENCEPLTYQIISAVYIEGLKDWQMADKLCYSSSQYQYIKRGCMCEFAERFEGFERRYGFDEDDQVKLVQKNRTLTRRRQ
nr:ArpU family phage packaging/lysis transcriptional regulator [Limosilactobacillus mucosae]